MNIISEIIIDSIKKNTKIIIPVDQKELIEISDGYMIQNEIFDYFSKNNQYKGWKIGCTTPVMQKYLNISSPCLGRVMKNKIFENNSKIKFDNFVNPGVECEIAVVLSENYKYKKKINDLNEIVEKIVPSIEIVDDRWPDYKKEKTSILIADNFFSSAIAYGNGSKKIKLDELKKLKGFMTVNNKIIGNGIGGDILNDPINALKWFLEFDFADNNFPKAGDLISLGSLVQTYWINKKDIIEINIESLGSVKITFE
jgi:2-keto-4-pentenoate hydratase